MSFPSPYKPSPLSIGSPRTSPFRRPESPANQFRSSTSTPTHNSHPSTPTASPTKTYPTTPSKLQASSTPPPHASTENITPQKLSTPKYTIPTTTTHTNTSTAPRTTPTTTATSTPPPRFVLPPVANTNFSSLPPHLLNDLRSAFTSLDRSGTGSITRADVTATLSDLGLPTTSADVAPFFPPGSSQSLPLAQFLGQLAGPLSQFSREDELMEAFGAFDERDCGEIDVDALRDALENTGGQGAMSAEEVDSVLEGFVGRRAFRKGNMGSEKGDVFRYRQWADEVLGKDPEQGKMSVK